MRKQVGQVALEVVRGNIAEQPDIQAIVNAANAQLEPGGGVAGAIHRAAGPGLQEECRPLAPIAPGQAVITSGHGLPNDSVIHCLGPVFGHDEPADDLLADCYRNALHLADNHSIASIAFPALSTGVFGFPRERAAKVSLAAVAETVPYLVSVRLVRFVLFDAADVQIYGRILRELED